MKRFGIIGDPVSHSLSPLLFRAAYDGKYPYDRIEGADFDRSWARFLAEYDGINVTAPFKELAAARADLRSDAVRRIGATNLLVKTAAGIYAENSDYLGVLLTLRRHGIVSGNALVVGCGGAGRAAAVAALDSGCRVTLMNRTRSKAEAFAAELPEAEFAVRDLAELREAVHDADLVLYTATFPAEGLASLTAEDFAGKTVLEANYKNPSLTEAQLSRCHAISGREWLLDQAVAGYKTFTGEDPDAGQMETTLKQI